MNLAADAVVVGTALVLIVRFSRARSPALLCLAIGFWLRVIVLGLSFVGPRLIRAMYGPDTSFEGIPPIAYALEAVGQAEHLLLIGSLVAIAYGATIAPIPGRSSAE